MMHDPIKTLAKKQKSNCSVHLDVLVFAYNTIPHSTMEYQLDQFMFECKTQVP